MCKLKKRKNIDKYDPRVESFYEAVKNIREQAMKVANNTPDEIKNKKIKYLLK